MLCEKKDLFLSRNILIPLFMPKSLKFWQEMTVLPVFSACVAVAGLGGAVWGDTAAAGSCC